MRFNHHPRGEGVGGNGFHFRPPETIAANSEAGRPNERARGIPNAESCSYR